MNNNDLQSNQSVIRLQSNYYTINEFNHKFNPLTPTCSRTDLRELNPIKNFSLFHWNARSLSKNFESLKLLLSSLNEFPFSVIGISETWLRSNSPNLFNLNNYKLFRSDRNKGRGGGVALYIFNEHRVRVRSDIHIEGCEDLFVEIVTEKCKNKIIGIIYRPPCNIPDTFLEKLDECLSIITRENKEVYLMGDFNIDMNKSDNLSLKLENTLMSYAFNHHISNPTRITNTSKTLLDNIFSNNQDLNNVTNGIIYYDMSDHLPIFVISETPDATQSVKKVRPILCRKETDNNIALLNQDLAQEEWSDVFRETDTNRAYDVFLNKLVYYYNKNIPLVKKKSRRKNKHPWITKGIMKSIKTRTKLYKRALTTQNAEDFKDYKIYRNKLSNLIRISRKMHYSKQCEHNKNNKNGLWEVINDIKGKNDKDHVSVFYNKNEELTNPKDISDSFNTYFTNIGPNLASKIKQDNNINFATFLPPNFNKSLFLTPTDEEEIFKIVRCLKTSRSSGHDGLSVHLLKRIVIHIATPLAYIFNLSITTGICPSSFKTAKVIPVFKKDDPSLLTNYRPISILPSMSKILEKIIYKRLYIFLQVNDILIPNQYGFRKHYSTDFAIIKLLNKITECFANKEHLIGIFMDLSKAFDTIDHNILMYKLQRYGIRGTSLSWIRDYLSNRKQYVVYQCSESPTSNITCGVPQGSILGPLLFLIYINDIVRSSPLLSFTLFADDTNIFYSHKNFDTLVSTLNSEISKVSQWFSCNKLSLNITKTNFIRFKPHSTQVIDPNYNIRINGLPLTELKSTKFLGITIDSCLSWNDHIHNVHTSVSKGIGILYRLKDFLSQNSLTILYNAIVLPYLTYCNIVWGNCSSTKINSILLLQKRALRLITNSSYRSPTDSLFSQLKILKISDIHTIQTAIFMHKYTFNRLPSVFDNFFIPNSNIHSYPTRNSSGYHLENPRIILAQKSLKHHGPDVWNSLPDSLKQCTKLHLFKQQFKNILLNQYSSNDQ